MPWATTGIFTLRIIKVRVLEGGFTHTCTHMHTITQHHTYTHIPAPVSGRNHSRAGYRGEYSLIEQKKISKCKCL